MICGITYAHSYTTTIHNNRIYHSYNGITKSLSSHHYIHTDYNITFVDYAYNLDTDNTIQSVQCDDINNVLTIQYTTSDNTYAQLNLQSIIHGGIRWRCMDQYQQIQPFYYTVSNIGSYDSSTLTATISVGVSNFMAVIHEGSFNINILNSSIGSLVHKNTVSNSSGVIEYNNHTTNSHQYHLMDALFSNSFNYDSTDNYATTNYTIFDETCSNAQCSASSTDDFCIACNSGLQLEVQVICDDCWL